MNLILLFKKILLSFTLVLLTTNIFAADYFWVGGNGNWSEINNWATTSGGTLKHSSVPTMIDNVIFDQNSGFLSGAVITVNTVANCKDMTWSGVLNNPIISGSSLNILNIYGSLTLQNGMTFSLNKVDFLSGQSETITTNGAILDGTNLFPMIRFNGLGSWMLMDDFLSTGNRYSITLLKGTLNTNGQTVNINDFVASNTQICHLILGESKVYSYSQNSFQFTSTQLILEASQSELYVMFEGNLTSKGIKGHQGQEYNRIYFPNSSIINGEISGGIKAKYVYFSGGGSIKGSNVFDTLILAAGREYVFAAGSTQTINLRFEAVALPCSALMSLRSSESLQSAILHFSPGVSVDISNGIISGLTATGDVPIVANSSIDNGENTGFIFPSSTGTTLYWVGGEGDWDDSRHWTEIDDGVFPAVSGCIPTPLDNVEFNERSGFITGSQAVRTVTIGGVVYCKNMIWNGVLNDPIIKGSSSSGVLNIYGSLTLQNDMTFSLNKVNFLSNQSETITTNGAILEGVNANPLITFNGLGSWTLLDDFLSTGNRYSIIFLEGMLNTNGQTVKLHSFTASNTQICHLILGESKVYSYGQNSFQFTSGQLILEANQSELYVMYEADLSSRGVRGRQGQEYNRIYFPNSSIINGEISGGIKAKYVYFAGGGSIKGSNVFDTLILAAGREYVFAAGSTQTINLRFEAVALPCSALMSLRSSESLQSAILHFSPGVSVDISNGIISGLTATGDVPIVANSSIDNGENTGFIFPSSTGTTLYWVGGEGDWDDSRHWSEIDDGVFPAVSGCIPTPLDNVEFNERSGFITGSQAVRTVTIGGIVYCKNMIWDGVLNDPIIKGSSSSGVLNIYGSLTLQNGMTFSLNKVNFLSEQAETITIDGAILEGVNTSPTIMFNGLGSWMLMDDFLSTGNRYSITFLKGMLNTNGQTVKVHSFTASDTQICHLILGESKVYSYSSSSFQFTGTQLILEANQSELYVMYEANLLSRGVRGRQGQEYNRIYFPNSSSINGGIRGGIKAKYVYFAGGGSIEGSNVFDTLILSAGREYAFESGSTQTINHKLYASGNPCFMYLFEIK